MVYDILMSILFAGLFVCWLSDFTDSEGLEFVNPIWLYKKYKVNWFGVGVVTIVFNILCLPFACCYWFCKLCTVGRK